MRLPRKTKAEAITIDVFLPKASEIQPEINDPTKQPATKEETITPCTHEVTGPNLFKKEGVMIVPEMAPVSYPSKNPPSAANEDTKCIYTWGINKVVFWVNTSTVVIRDKGFLKSKQIPHSLDRLARFRNDRRLGEPIHEQGGARSRKPAEFSRTQQRCQGGGTRPLEKKSKHRGVDSAGLLPKWARTPG